MKVIAGGLSNRTRFLSILLLFAVLASVLGLGTAAYRKSALKGANGGAGRGEDYIYGAYGAATGGQPASARARGKGVLVLGRDYDSNRTDAVICVYFNYDTGGISTLQIPRDTYVRDGEYSGRINALLPRYRSFAVNDGAKDATHDGIRALMRKIEADFGTPLDNYVFLDCAAVERLTDALGGVTLDIPADIDYNDTDRGMSLHLKKGVHRLNGRQAAQFLRYRQGYPQADIGRINAQKLYAAAMMSRLSNLSAPSAAASLAKALSSCVKTDLTAEDTALLAAKLCMADRERVVMYTLPGDGVKVGRGCYYGVYKDVLADILEKGFAAVDEDSLTAVGFPRESCGYTDAAGVRLSAALKGGVSIPVYKSGRP